MKKTPDFDAAADFLAATARVLDRRVFERLFAGGTAEPVRDAVTAYRNADGGFGYALEPDLRTPASQPAAVEMALRIMDLADAWDEPLVRAAIDWLATIAPAEGGATFVLPTLSQGPHAPWWVAPEGNPASLIQTGQIAGLLYSRHFAHPWLDGATRFMWSAIDELTEPENGYVMFGVLAFLEEVPDRARAEAAFERVGPLLLSRGLVDARPRGRGRDAVAPRLRAPAGLDRAPPVRPANDRGPPRPPGRRSARRRRLDVQLARLVPRRRGRLARLPHGRRAPGAARERPRLGVSGRRRPAALDGCLLAWLLEMAIVGRSAKAAGTLEKTGKHTGSW